MPEREAGAKVIRGFDLMRTGSVSFPLKTLHFVLKNRRFLLKNRRFLLKNRRS